MSSNKDFNIYSTMLVHQFLEKSAVIFPDKPALIHEGTRVTYKEINNKANQLAGWLSSQKINSGDRVVILLENSIEYVISYYGILKSGAVAVPVSTGIKADAFISLLEEITPHAIISSYKFEHLLESIDDMFFKETKTVIQNSKINWENSNRIIVQFESVFDGSNPENSQRNIQENDIANIIYTSGSTGKPKGAVLTHRNMVSNINSICTSLKLTSDDIQMVVLPFFYVMGKSLLNTLVAVGGTLVINNKFAFPATVINQMIDEKVTLFSGVPSTYAFLLHRSPLKQKSDELKNLRLVTQAGGHMARSVKAALRAALPGHTNICIMYGATEASARLTCLAPEDFDKRMDSVGKAIDGVTIKILDEKGMAVAQGDKGEVVASGPNIMNGYWKDSESTERVLDNLGYHTGDIGWKDKDGFLFVEGRKDNILKVGGHRINPQEIEHAILATQLVVESVVLGLQDDLLGTRIVALIVPMNGEVSLDSINAKCAKILPKYKLPSEMISLRSLPKNANGKIDRAQCRNLLKST